MLDNYTLVERMKALAAKATARVKATRPLSDMTLTPGSNPAPPSLSLTQGSLPTTPPAPPASGLTH